MTEFVAAGDGVMTAALTAIDAGERDVESLPAGSSGADKGERATVRSWRLSRHSSCRSRRLPAMTAGCCLGFPEKLDFQSPASARVRAWEFSCSKPSCLANQVRRKWRRTNPSLNISIHRF